MVRESLWTDEQQMNLAEFASFLTTWSGIQNLRQKKGDLHAQAVLDEFITKSRLIDIDPPIKFNPKSFLVARKH